jgi:DNA-binding beta-propeller fold protein YncE
MDDKAEQLGSSSSGGNRMLRTRDRGTSATFLVFAMAIWLDCSRSSATYDAAPDLARSPNPDSAVASSVQDGPRSVVRDAGPGISVPSIYQLVPDPRAGLLYGLGDKQVLVFDTAQRLQVATVNLGGVTRDLDLSPDGLILVGAQYGETRLVVIDKTQWSVSYVQTRAAPYNVEAMNGGIAYYATMDQWSEVHQVDLALGKSGDIKLNLYSSYEPDLELSPSGERLFVAESALSPSTIYALDLTVAPTQTVDDYKNFTSPPRQVYVGPSGKYVYYAGCQLDAKKLASIRCKFDFPFAENVAGTFAVSPYGLVDTGSCDLIASFAKPVSLATLVNDDTEVWYRDGKDSRLVWVKVADLLAGQ